MSATCSQQTKISSSVFPYWLTVFGRPPLFIQVLTFLPTMPGIIMARPMHTALQNGAPSESALKM